MKKMKRLIVILPLLALAFAFSGGVGADKPEVMLSVIGTFPEDGTMNLEQFRGAALMDDRFAALESRHLRQEVVGAVQWLERLENFRATHVYSAALNGFAAELTARQIDMLQEKYGITFEQSQTFHTQQAQVLPWGINRVDADSSSTAAGNGSGSVTNVRVFVIDTGVGTHTDLNRVNHVNFAGGTNNDCNGHGTHVAGTIAARDNGTGVVGVVPGAPVTGVKVLGCSGSGSTAGIIQGIDWVTANAVRPAVANMSLGGGVSTALDAAVRRSVARGIVYALAAGNNAGNACNTSPARAGAGSNNGIITTASTTSTNAESSFSNFGSCVDVWAPGSSVLSTRLGGGTTTFSGTSMASPHAAGVAALFLSRSTGSSPATVESQVKANMLGFGTSSKDGRAIRIVNARNF